MKNMKKFVALLVAVVMVFAMTTVASAATVDNQTEGHTYDAYQIFTGTQAADDAALGDVYWGSGLTATTAGEFLTALKALTVTAGEEELTPFAGCTDAASVADVLTKAEDNANAFAKAFANEAAKYVDGTKATITTESVNLAAGYYLLIDVTENIADGDAKNPALLQVTNSGNITISEKYNVPTVDKEIDGAGEADATTAAIGDVIDFTITGTLPDNYADYESYKYEFTDTMSAGLTLVDSDKDGDLADEVTVSIAGVDAEDINATVRVTDNTDGTTSITVTFDNLKAIAAVTADSNVVVTYSATLNEDAVIGNPGNPNTVKLTYTNDPNYVGDGEPTTSDTPEDTVVVFTFEADVNKINEAGKPLNGAGFTLYKYDATDELWHMVGEEIRAEGEEALTTFVFKGLDEGKYKLAETTVPGGYNRAEDIEFTIDATYTENGVSELTVDNADFTIKQEEVKDTGEDVNGVLETTVVNQKGGVLPETGGIGTTIFYVVGGLLVVGALVVLVSKKRMSKEG